MGDIMNYLDSLNDEVRNYFNILCSDFPEWLLDYINTPEMQRIGGISMSCGTDYSKIFNVRYWHSNLDHSVGVALIIWHFTHDKKQTLAGLFHDIANPVFKHCVDFLNNDHERQESIDDRIYDILRNSTEIKHLLNRDGIKFEEVDDYKLYPIADNDTPKLSADRFEYTFSSGLVFYRVWELDEIKRCYENVIIAKNEEGIDELCFKDVDVCEKYIKTISKLWPHWIDNDDKIVMQFIADILKAMIEGGYLTVDDIYAISEQEVINRILSCPDKYIAESFKKLQNATTVHNSDVQVDEKYCVNVKAKRRYIVPLVIKDKVAIRINHVSNSAKSDIENYLKFNTTKFAYLDFDFKPKLLNVFAKTQPK